MMKNLMHIQIDNDSHSYEILSNDLLFHIWNWWNEWVSIYLNISYFVISISIHLLLSFWFILFILFIDEWYLMIIWEIVSLFHNSFQQHLHLIQFIFQSKSISHNYYIFQLKWVSIICGFWKSLHNILHQWWFLVLWSSNPLIILWFILFCFFLLFYMFSFFNWNFE